MLQLLDYKLRTLFAFSLLAASVALAQKPLAPFSDPNDTDNPGQKLIFEQTITVPKDGKVVIPFFPPFQRTPGCAFEGGTIPGEAPKVTAEEASIKAKRGAKMHYRCAGIRKDSGSNSTERKDRP
jgi:hypothetical protein